MPRLATQYSMKMFAILFVTVPFAVGKALQNPEHRFFTTTLYLSLLSALGKEPWTSMGTKSRGTSERFSGVIITSCLSVYYVCLTITWPQQYTHDCLWATSRSAIIWCLTFAARQAVSRIASSDVDERFLIAVSTGYNAPKVPSIGEIRTDVHSASELCLDFRSLIVSVSLLCERSLDYGSSSFLTFCGYLSSLLLSTWFPACLLPSLSPSLFSVSSSCCGFVSVITSTAISSTTLFLSVTFILSTFFASGVWCSKVDRWITPNFKQ